MSIYVAGLTGQTGSGKSTVADIFRAHGVCVIDCDNLAREIVEPGSPVLVDLARLFGDDLILSDGSLDRHKLARRAFASEENTNLLNSVTHPAITALARKRVAEAEKNGYKIAMVRRARALRERASRRLPRGDMRLRAERSAHGTAHEPRRNRLRRNRKKNVRSAR